MCPLNAKAPIFTSRPRAGRNRKIRASRVSKRYQKPPPPATTSEPSFPYIPPQFRDAGIQSIHPYPLVLTTTRSGREAVDPPPSHGTNLPPCRASTPQLLRRDHILRRGRAQTPTTSDINGWPYGKPAILPTTDRPSPRHRQDARPLRPRNSSPCGTATPLGTGSVIPTRPAQ